MIKLLFPENNVLMGGTMLEKLLIFPFPFYLTMEMGHDYK